MIPDAAGRTLDYVPSRACGGVRPLWGAQRSAKIPLSACYVSCQRLRTCRQCAACEKCQQELHLDSQLVPCEMLGMPTNNLLWPDQPLMRLENLFARRCDEPNSYGCSDNRVEGCISGNGDQQAGRRWREGHV